MKKQLKKVLLILLVVSFLFTVSSCDPLNNLLENLGGTNNSDSTKTEEGYITVAFDYNNNLTEKIFLKIESNQTIYEPINPYMAGYKFLGWHYEDELYDFSNKLLKDTTLKAKWELNDDLIDEDNFLITYDYNMPKYNSVTIKVEKGNKTIEPLTPKRINYKFLGWVVNLSDAEPFDFNEPATSNITLKAKWEETTTTIKEDINVTFNYNEEQSIKVKIPSQSRVIEPKEPTKDGFTFLGWYNDFDESLFNFQTVLTSDTSLSPKWQEGESQVEEPTSDFVRVTFNFSASNAPKLKEIQIKKGSKLLEPKSPTDEHSEFIGWYINKEDEESFDFNAAVNKDLGLVAKWEHKAYEPKYNNVTFISYGDELIVNTTKAERGFELDKPVDPVKEYYDFKGWYEKDSILAFDFTNTLIDRDYVLVAKFELKDELVNVFYEYNDQKTTIKNKLGGLTTPPTIDIDPVNTLLGWKDSEGNFFDFSTPVYETLTLKAVIYPLMENHINYISQNVIRGNVRIIKTLWESEFEIPSNKIAQYGGSGVIFKEKDGFYYVLTNSHVITTHYKADDGAPLQAHKATFVIEDYLGREYETVEVVLDGLEETIDHDLAILRFALKERDLKVINISETFDESHLLTTIGQPNSQKNTITLGTFEKEDSITLKLNGTSRTLNTYKITTPGAKGSSGSMVINQNFEVVGIIFAGAANIEFADANYMFAVPLMVIKDFISIFEQQIVTSLIYNSGVGLRTYSRK